MSWRTIAVKDFRDARRSWWLWGLSAVFILLVGGVAGLMAVATQYFGVERLSSSTLLQLLTRAHIITYVVPLIAFVMAYTAVSGERDSGSLRLLLAPPVTRGEAVFGKFLGRSGAVVGPVLIGFVVPAIAFAVTVPFEPLPYFGYALLSAAIAVVFVGIAVGASAAFRSHRLVILLLLAFYFVFIVLWGTIQVPLQWALVFGGYPDALQWIPMEPTELLRFLRVINPTGAFKIIAQNLLQGTLFAPNVEQVRPSYHAGAILSLITWTAAPLLLGWARFEQGDL
jgi:ABC-2 type transport system permease protein